jgi:type III pantothenate kinase
MNLAVDIGNTCVSLGLFKADRLMKRVAVPTQSREYRSFLKKFFGKYNLEKAIISSVVPQAIGKTEDALKSLKIKNILLLGRDLAVPVKNRYKSPKKTGQDRLVNAFAAINYYGSPAIVVDFGTAVTFDAVSRNKEYLGGLIIPGLQTSLNTLAEKTALLPRIKLNKPPANLIGRTTRESMLSGIIHGYASLTDGLIRELRKKLGKNAPAIGTGGNIDFIAPWCKEFTVVDINLTLKGLNLILLSRRFPN